jgi:hypothetical protein
MMMTWDLNLRTPTGWPPQGYVFGHTWQPHVCFFLRKSSSFSYSFKRFHGATQLICQHGFVKGENLLRISISMLDAVLGNPLEAYPRPLPVAQTSLFKSLLSYKPD